MKALRTLKLAAKLHKVTHLGSQCPNVTRWSSNVNMLERYVQLRPFISSFDAEDFDFSLQCIRENKGIDKMSENLKSWKQSQKLWSLNLPR